MSTCPARATRTAGRYRAARCAATLTRSSLRLAGASRGTSLLAGAGARARRPPCTRTASTLRCAAARTRARAMRDSSLPAHSCTATTTKSPAAASSTASATSAARCTGSSRRWRRTTQRQQLRCRFRRRRCQSRSAGPTRTSQQAAVECAASLPRCCVASTSVPAYSRRVNMGVHWRLSKCVPLPRDGDERALCA